MRDKLEQALAYISLGLPVLPLHHIQEGRCSCGREDCSSPGKHPRTRNGVKDASLEQAQVRAWWQQWPEANLGLAMGKEAGVFALDIDGEAGEESLRDLSDELGPLPDSWEQLTGGGGRHLLFVQPGFPIRNKVRLLPGLDTRGDGGYIVAAPSNHQSGRDYVWELSGTPGEIPAAQLPELWLHYLRYNMEAEQKSSRKGQRPGVGGEVESLSEGSRNDGLFRLGASLRAKGLSEQGIVAALAAENRARCQPPLPDAEVQQIAQSCGRYEAGALPSAEAAVKLEENDAYAALKAQLPVAEPGGLYADALMEIVVQLETDNSPYFFAAKELLMGQKGFKMSDFNQAKKMYRQRQRQMRLVKEGDKLQLEPLRKLLPEDGFLHAFVLPEDWRLDGAMIYRTIFRNEMPVREVACPHLIFPVERMVNADTGTEKVKLAYYRDSEWRSLIADKSMVASRREIVALADSGVQVTSENAKNLINYLSDFETANAEALPVSRSLSRVGWLNMKQFAPYTEDLVFDGEAAFRGLYTAICEKGSLGAWCDLMLQARESLQLRAMLAASFAAPLLWLLDGQCFFVHLWGTRSGIGKSVALQAALSAWGNPDKLWRSFNSTEVALERTAAFFHSLPVGLDELQTFNFQWKDGMSGAKKLVYKLSQGQGKGRGKKSGGVDQMNEWRTIFLSTGEQPLGEDLSTEGALARVIELYLTDGSYPNSLAPQALASHLQVNYGGAGRRYIAQLSEWLAEGREPLLALARELEASLLALSADYGGKQIKALSYLALGDALAARFLFGQNEAEANWSAVQMAGEIAQGLVTRSETDPAAQAWEWLLSWLAVNEEHFQETARSGVPRYGVMKLTPGGRRDCCVLSTVLNKELQAAGFSPRAATRALADQNYILRGKDGKIRIPKWVGNIGVAGCYVLNGDLLGQQNEAVEP